MTTMKTKDYSQGKIYKIEPLGEFDEGDIYIGQTTQRLLSQRMGKHRCCYWCWKNGKCGKTTSFELFDKYGIDNCRILLLETVTASNYDELASREAYYIRTLKCVNKIIPLRTDTEYYKDNEEEIKVYQKKYHDKYYNEKKDLINEKNRQYYEENKDEIRSKANEKKKGKKQYNTKYYEAYKKAIREKVLQLYHKKKQEKLDRQNNTVVVNS